mmetsp:Transcript_54699/g.131930  ORF Transcript_54699/g.131930 Transcript_54699/m.131930 type:complete len:179 (-) Transcript_54699:70-606(-)
MPEPLGAHLASAEQASDPAGDLPRQSVLDAFGRWDAGGDGTISGTRLRHLLVDAEVPEAHLNAICARAGVSLDDDQINYTNFTDWVFASAPPALRDLLVVGLRPGPGTPGRVGLGGVQDLEDQAQLLLDEMDLTTTMPRQGAARLEGHLPEEEVQQWLDELNLTLCATPKGDTSVSSC